MQHETSKNKSFEKEIIFYPPPYVWLPLFREILGDFPMSRGISLRVGLLGLFFSLVALDRFFPKILAAKK